MSLDDIIKKSKIGKGGRRGGRQSNKQNTARGGRQRNNGFKPRNLVRGRGNRRIMGQRKAQPQRFIPVRIIFSKCSVIIFHILFHFLER